MKCRRNLLAGIIACGIALVAYATPAPVYAHGGGHGGGHGGHGGGHGGHGGGHGGHGGGYGGYSGQGGGHHHHHHHNHGGGSYGGGYSQPYTTYYAPVANYLPQPAYSGAPITISNSEALGGVVQYGLNEYPYAIYSGQVQTIQSDRSWVVSFDRGAGNGEARYTLYPGDYEFRATPSGWELFRLP